MRRHAWLLAAGAILAGCASKPHFDATWYLQEGRTNLVVAVLNRAETPVYVEAVVLNARPGDPLSGWRAKIGRCVNSGEILFRSIDVFVSKTEKAWECRVPTSVLVVGKEGNLDCPAPANPSWFASNELAYKADVVGTLPSSIPDIWSKCSTN